MRLIVRTQDGALLDLPASLKVITTYVILEQERWFERHLDFLLTWLRSDMTVIDIGANVGVYAMPMAKRCATRATPTSPAVRRGAISSAVDLLNHAANLQIGPQALSDASRRGHLAHGRLERAEPPWQVATAHRASPWRSSCLDEQDRLHHWSPDFVKIDAEYEEPKIIAGGTSFFRRHSPLVMFEIAAPVPDLMAAFASVGYRTYRVLPSRPLLVPHEFFPTIMTTMRGSLFAAKPDRVEELAATGLLIDEALPFVPDASAREQALPFLFAQPFAALLRSLDTALDPAYRDALAGYAVWRQSGNPSALDFAFRQLVDLSRDDAPSPAALVHAREGRLVKQAVVALSAESTPETVHAASEHSIPSPSRSGPQVRVSTASRRMRGHFSDWFVRPPRSSTKRIALPSPVIMRLRLAPISISNGLRQPRRRWIVGNLR